MGFIQSMAGAIVSPFLISESIWCVKLRSGKVLSERDTVFDIERGEKRAFDWHDDLVKHDDHLKIIELWLICPPNHVSPLGNTARLKITEPGTAFQFKVKTLDVGIDRHRESQVIGRVEDKVSGDCVCFIWDDVLRVMSTPYHTNIYEFKSWRDGIAPPRHFNFKALGLNLD